MKPLVTSTCATQARRCTRSCRDGLRPRSRTAEGHNAVDATGTLIATISDGSKKKTPPGVRGVLELSASECLAHPSPRRYRRGPRRWYTSKPFVRCDRHDPEGYARAFLESGRGITRDQSGGGCLGSGREGDETSGAAASSRTKRSYGMQPPGSILPCNHGVECAMVYARLRPRQRRNQTLRRGFAFQISRFLFVSRYSGPSPRANRQQGSDGHPSSESERRRTVPGGNGTATNQANQKWAYTAVVERAPATTASGGAGRALRDSRPSVGLQVRRRPTLFRSEAKKRQCASRFTLQGRRDRGRRFGHRSVAPSCRPNR